MVWTLDLDDFTGLFCNEGTFPLINTLKSGLETGNPGKSTCGVHCTCTTCQCTDYISRTDYSP